MTSHTFAIRGIRALAGASLEPIEPAVVVVIDERIVAIGREDTVAVPEGAISFDGAGLTLTPGFIDSHVHIGFYDPADVVRGGVTTARDLGWPPLEIHETAARSRDGTFNGPEILAAGPILTARGGYPTRAPWAPRGTGREVIDEEAARTTVNMTVDEGACIIKISLTPPVGPTFDLPTLRAIVETAHERGLKVTGHVHGIRELDKALDAGMDELAHMLMSEELIPDETIDRMVEQGMVVVPTLSIRFGRDREIALANLGRFRDAGGRSIYGTDLGNEGPQPGIDGREVAALAESGYPPAEIVRSATVEAAAWLGLADRGVLLPGALADMVALRGSLQQPSDLQEVAAVWRRGVRRDLKEFDSHNLDP